MAFRIALLLLIAASFFSEIGSQESISDELERRLEQKDISDPSLDSTATTAATSTTDKLTDRLHKIKTVVNKIADAVEDGDGQAWADGETAAAVLGILSLCGTIFGLLLKFVLAVRRFQRDDPAALHECCADSLATICKAFGKGVPDRTAPKVSIWTTRRSADGCLETDV